MSTTSTPSSPFIPGQLCFDKPLRRYVRVLRVTESCVVFMTKRGREEFVTHAIAGREFEPAKRENAAKGSASAHVPKVGRIIQLHLTARGLCTDGETYGIGLPRYRAEIADQTVQVRATSLASARRQLRQLALQYAETGDLKQWLVE